MSKYVIEKILEQDDITQEGRIVIRNHLSKKLILFILFPEETLGNNGKLIEDFSEGDILEGNIVIEWAGIRKKTSKSLRHKQAKKSSFSYIEAVVEVVEIVNEDYVYALTSIVEEKILINFEVEKVNFNVGDRILVNGSLTIYSDDYLEDYLDL